MKPSCLLLLLLSSTSGGATRPAVPETADRDLAEPLRVLRAQPATPADPFAAITVMFDRPVAGGLDATVDAAAIFRIEPAVAGKVEWRDPVTLRFTPAAPLVPGTTYRITVSPTFRAMDGSRLEGAFEHTFRVSPPRVLHGDPVGPGTIPRHLGREPTFRVLVSAPVEPAALAAAARLRMDRSCGSPVIPLRPVLSRRLRSDDPQTFVHTGYSGPYPADTARDLRRVIELAPATPLPLACGGALLLPDEIAPAAQGGHTWPFATYGPLRFVRATCATGKECPTGPVQLEFTTPVRGAELRRRVRVEPGVAVQVRDTAEESAIWTVEARLRPRRPYSVVLDTALTDVFGQRLQGVAVRAFLTTGYAPSLNYPYGRLLVERRGFGTLAVEHVNVDTLVVTAVAVPDSLEGTFLARSWSWGEPWAALAPSAVRARVPAQGAVDQGMVTGVRVDRLLPPGARRSLVALRVTSPALDTAVRNATPIAVVQVSDLAVHARVGLDEGVVWVTGVHDGLPRAGAAVTLRDRKGRVRARGRTDHEGIARLTSFARGDECDDWECEGFDGTVVAELGGDRAVVGIHAWDPDLAPWRFGVESAYGEERAPAAAAVFTERGIYRPGETVYAKAIVRHGPLGALLPPRGDSIRWVFHNREGASMQEAVAASSEFGTADHALRLAPELPLGEYQVLLQMRREGRWRTLATTSYDVAEYRPPEFLVDMEIEARTRFGGDTARAHVAGRYLFGASMARAPVAWALRRRPLPTWEFRIPAAEDYRVGVEPDWWNYAGDADAAQVVATGSDTLDATGRLDLALPLAGPADGRPARASVIATVTDANRQTVTAGAQLLVHPAAFYVGVRPRGRGYFWTAGTPVTLEVAALRPEGGLVADVAVQGALIRREWHRARRTREGQTQEVGGWVADTVGTCAVRTRSEPVPCTFTPPAGGMYTVAFQATDPVGRVAATSFGRWAAGAGWVPWNDEGQLKLDVVVDRERYAVGDTATILFASPFTDAEAWVTLERERVLESRRMRLSSGATTIKVPITEAHAPNVYVSIVVVRGRSAPPGPLDDPGRPTLRVGYGELRVTPEVKRLVVNVTPVQPEYRPGDTARVRLAVRDGQGRGQRAEVTLWAVDEGVLALTGYRTPDPLDLLYPPRGLGIRLGSNLVSVAPQIPEGPKGRRAPGGGGGADLTGILRSRFQTTAFFLGSVVTDANGEAVASARLPDNLTTFRVMAVAVTAGDRYGSGESKLLVTRPLIARPALPRFGREGDRFAAGVIVNSRMGGSQTVQVEAKASGIKLEGKKGRKERVEAGRGVESRFRFRALAGDSARFRFDVRGGGEADAVSVSIPMKPAFYPVAQTVAGVLRDSATVEFALLGDVDPARSRVEISFGSSPAAVIRGAARDLRVYPYECTEQVGSRALPLIALRRAGRSLGDSSLAGPRAVDEIATAVRVISRRQRADGGIGFWSADDWTTPWLTAYAGRVLLEARAAGVAVPDSVLARIAAYLAGTLNKPEEPRAAVVAWYGDASNRLAERIAAADFLSRYGKPDIPAENSLLSQASRLRWEDRLLLAQAFGRRRDLANARALVSAGLAGVRVEGRTAVLPEVVRASHYFESRIRPVARLLEALLDIDPRHALIGPLAETLVQQGRAEAARPWNTQDYGAAVLALMRLEDRRRAEGETRVRILAGRRTLLDTRAGGAARADTALPLAGLVAKGPQGKPVLRLRLDATGEAPAYYFLTVHEVARSARLEPLDRGIQVERWYEGVDDARPLTRAAEGQLVRVRLRITLPAERHFVVLDDPLPAGLEPVDLSLRTVSPFGAAEEPRAGEQPEERQSGQWYFGSWEAGTWSPFDHKELRDERVLYSAAVLWPGSYTATYLARATTAGTFLAPPAHAEEMYNPGVNGRSGGVVFVVGGGGK